MQGVWPDSVAASGRAGVYDPMREAGGGGQDTWAELQETAESLKELRLTFLGAREKSSVPCTGTFPPERVNESCPPPPRAL